MYVCVYVSVYVRVLGCFVFGFVFFWCLCNNERGGGVKGGGPEGYNMNGEHFSALFARE